MTFKDIFATWVGVPALAGFFGQFRLRTLPHRRTAIQLCAILCLSYLPLHADDFETGTEAYHQSEYAEAAAAFERSLESAATAAAHHNLALSYFQLGEPAKAVWHLERAVRIEPLNEDYLFKLGALRQQLGLYALPAEWWQSAARLLPTASWIWIASLSGWILLAAIILPLVAGKRRPIALKLLMALSLLGLLLPGAALGILGTQQADGVVVNDEATPLHHAPASAAPQSGIARPGERTRFLDTHGNFLKVETEAKVVGWIAADGVRKL